MDVSVPVCVVRICVHVCMCVCMEYACVFVCASVYVCGGDIFCWRGTESASVLCPWRT